MLITFICTYQTKTLILHYQITPEAMEWRGKELKHIIMGLDTTHNAWHGAYSSFNRFRHSLMLAYNGTNLSNYSGYGGNLAIENIEHKGLYEFFNHSDCDGEISANDCKLVADGLSEILPKLNDDYDIMRCKEFIAGCLLAYSKNEPLEFN